MIYDNIRVAVFIIVAILVVVTITGCTYRDGGWVSIAHDPENDPYYWAQISHEVGAIHHGHDRCDYHTERPWCHRHPE